MLYCWNMFFSHITLAFTTSETFTYKKWYVQNILECNQVQLHSISLVHIPFVSPWVQSCCFFCIWTKDMSLCFSGSWWNCAVVLSIILDQRYMMLRLMQKTWNLMSSYYMSIYTNLWVWMRCHKSTHKALSWCAYACDLASCGICWILSLRMKVMRNL